MATRPTRRVTVIDPTGSRKFRVELPANINSARVIGQLVTRMGLPATNTDGRTVNYRWDIETDDGEGRAINPDETLEDADVEDGATLRIMTEMRAGLTDKTPTAS